MKNLRKIITLFILIAGVSSLASCVRDKEASLAMTPSSPATASSGTSETTPATTSPETSPAESSSTAAAALKLEVEPKMIIRGSPCLFVATSSDALSSLSGKWLGKKVFFNSDQARKTWYGLGGVGLETPLGSKDVALEGRTVSGQLVTLNAKVEVEARKSDIRVPHEYINPDDDDKARIAREAELKSEKFRTLSPHFLWNGSFARPVADNIQVTAIFAGKRRFNNGPIKVHKGIDYGAPSGVSIKAINSGRVILAKNLFYDGNMVTIDHGQGMLSLYLHLSKMNVREGDMVASGQEIGLSGGTGRASGPHLHLQVKWEGIDIDPATLMQLKLPTNLIKTN
jgi:murein DD-endopeptidase MepM/ murein hydrolase activator NlpD